MNLAVEIFEIVAAMTDHGMRESGERLFRNFDRTGGEKLVVWEHRKTFNAQRPTFNLEARR